MPVRLPAALRSPLLSLALVGPKSFAQLRHPLAAHAGQLAHASYHGIQFNVCYEDTLTEVLSQFASERILCVFLLHEPTPAVLETISKFTLPALTTAARGERDKFEQYKPGCRLWGEFESSDEFWGLLFQAASAVTGDSVQELSEASAKAKEEFNDVRARMGYHYYPKFRPCRNLHRTFCTLLSPASYWEIPDKIIEHTNRPEELMNLVEHCLKLHFVASNMEMDGKKFGGCIPPMIWALPSHDPWARKQLLRQAIRETGPYGAVARQVVAASFLEQGIDDYDFRSEMRSDLSPTMAGLQLLGERIAFVDDMAALHGSFRESPCLRSPLRGGSLGHVLGAFNPKTFRNARDYGKVREQIGRAGKLMGRVVSSRLAEVIPAPVSTVVAISDLPVEWLAINDEPLAFLTDLCRLPESPPTSLLAQFVRNSHFEYTIDDSTLKRTLVVCGAAKSDPIYLGFEVARDLIAGKGAPVTFVHCDSREAFFEAIASIEPELLVVDCHGDFRENVTGSVLHFGSETVTGDDIVARISSPPLVMLSCCWGAPIYGCANTITQAFFEVGALSVITTMLPVDASQAAKLYIRLLNNLAEAAKVPVHETWSAFVSHLLRTSLFDDCLHRLPDDLHLVAFEAQGALERRARWQELTMNPRTRRGMFSGVVAAVSEIFPPEHRGKVRHILDKNDFVPECLFYCHMGRGDLIQFKCWKEEHHLPLSPDATAGVAARKN